ncbi:MAG: hypothetical protein AB7S44_00780 [Spirochaetales bacterium]
MTKFAEMNVDVSKFGFRAIEMSEKEAVNHARTIALRNKLLKNGSVNAEIPYKLGRHEKSALVTVKYNGEGLSMVDGHHSKRYDNEALIEPIADR